jgi:hypothetical protein
MSVNTIVTVPVGRSMDGLCQQPNRQAVSARACFGYGKPPTPHTDTTEPAMTDKKITPSNPEILPVATTEDEKAQPTDRKTSGYRYGGRKTACFKGGRKSSSFRYGG